jgi:hypothetical protein
MALARALAVDPRCSFWTSRSGIGRPGAQGAPGLAPPPARRRARDHRARHARSGRGDGHRRSHRAHERGADRADGQAPRPLRAPVDRVRDELRRASQPAGQRLRAPP